MKTLELNQMEKINGGVTREEYCKTLRMLLDNPDNVLPDGDFWYQYYCVAIPYLN